MRYLRFVLNFGDKGWGRLTQTLEIDADGWVTRHIEQYENGSVLKYDTEHRVDEYGFLADQQLPDDLGPDDVDGSLEPIDRDEFQGLWANLDALNRPEAG